MSDTRQAQTDEWRPVRTHTILRRFWRGPGGTKRFVGQQEDETLRRVAREHPIFYIGSAVPLLLSCLFLALVVWLGTRHVLSDSVYTVLYVIGGLAVLGSAAYCVYRIFELWWVNVYLITDKRVLAWSGLLQPTRDETTLDRVQQVALEQPLLGMLLSYGTVHVYLAGGKAIVLKNVPRPQRVRDDIEGVLQSYTATKPIGSPPAPTAPLAAPTPANVLQELSKQDALPQLPDADARYEHLRVPGRVRGPLRRFGGPLHIPSDVHYDAEEYTVMYLQRARWLLAIRLFIPAALLLVCLVGAFSASRYFQLFAVAFVVILLTMGLMIINYIDDVFILTNKRIIDINRKFIVLSAQHNITTYDKISKIEVKSPNVLQLALDIGNLYIETQGDNPNLHMYNIPHPFFVQDKIYEIRGFKDRVEKIRARNERKGELSEWFSAMMATMDRQSQTVPDLRSLDLWDAVELAGQLGIKVVPIGESSKYPSLGPGKVAVQIPPPGTLMHIDQSTPRGKPQIQVILSRR